MISLRSCVNSSALLGHFPLCFTMERYAISTIDKNFAYVPYIYDLFSFLLSNFSSLFILLPPLVVFCIWYSRCALQRWL